MILSLHDSCFEGKPAGRVAEWRRALQELNHEKGLRPVRSLQNPQVELLARGDLGFTFRLLAEEEIPVQIDLRRRHLQPHFDAYKEVIEHLLAPQGSAYGVEALDYGKKLVHDEAADFLKSALRDHLDLAHSTARRLFTLLFLLGNDIPWSQIQMHPRY
jgi:uncharacterized protein (UPF0262 family)